MKRIAYHSMPCKSNEIRIISRSLSKSIKIPYFQISMVRENINIDIALHLYSLERLYEEDKDEDTSKSLYRKSSKFFES